MDKKIFGALALVLLAGAGCATTGTVDTQIDTNSAVSETSEINAAESAAGGTVEAGADIDISNDMIGGDAVAGAEVDDVKEFTITGGNFEFTPAMMTVKKGDTVRITFKNVEGFHDFTLDAFDVATKQIGADAEETVEFVADEAGSFEYYCSVGKHREMGMKGTLTVTE
ncbi:MAG: cupredoxin domain-containing protein [Patescibacteria group bacterium]